MRLILFRCGIAILLLASSIALGQASTEQTIKVDICEVLQNPLSYDGKAISFRGQLEFEFEGDHIDDSDCALPPLNVGIWWDYGGESVLASGSDAARIKAETSPVLKDAQFHAFRQYVYAHRGSRPNGERCESYKACAFYNVTATFTGKFSAGKTEPNKAPHRFGHMACCHLFVIEQISDVIPKRTSVPPSETKFRCSTENWQSDYPTFPTPSVPNRLEANKQFMSDQLRAHGDEALVVEMKENLSWYAGMDGRLTWSSADLLTAYTAQFPPASKKKKTKKGEAVLSATPIIMRITSERCEPLIN